MQAGQRLYQLDATQETAALAAATAQTRAARAELNDLSTGARPEEIAVLDAQVAEARAALDYARAERQRWRSLGNQGVATPEEVLQADTAYATARAALQAAEANRAVAELPARTEMQTAARARVAVAEATEQERQWQFDQRTVAATQAGRVEAVYQHEGEYVTTGTPLLALMPENGIKIRFFVPEVQVGQLATGDEIQLRTDAADSTQKAVIGFIGREAEFTPPVIYSVGTRDKLLFMVEARPLDPTGLRPGVPVDVKLP